MNAAPLRKRAGHYHHGDLRRALIDAALELIDEEGVSAVTTRALARRLGVSHAAPAHHFKDRDALLAQVATEAFRAFADRLDQVARAQPDAYERLVALGCEYVRFAADHPAYVRVMFGRGFPDCYEPPSSLQLEAARSFQALTDAMEALAATIKPRPGPVDELAYGAWSLAHGLAMLWVDGPARRALGGRAELEAMTERIMRRAIPGLLPGAVPTRKAARAR